MHRQYLISDIRYVGRQRTKFANYFNVQLLLVYRDFQDKKQKVVVSPPFALNSATGRGFLKCLSPDLDLSRITDWNEAVKLLSRAFRNAEQNVQITWANKGKFDIKLAKTFIHLEHVYEWPAEKPVVDFAKILAPVIETELYSNQLEFRKAG